VLRKLATALPMMAPGALARCVEHAEALRNAVLSAENDAGWAFAADESLAALHAGDTELASALVKLAEAPRAGLSRVVYNVGAFSPAAEEVRKHVVAAFPGAEISYQPHLKRQTIVDTWPADVDDSAARRDWGFAPLYDEERAFRDYLVPTIREQYRRGPKA